MDSIKQFHEISGSEKKEALCLAHVDGVTLMGSELV